ncbi:Similar to Quinone oxidoreductase-like protein 2 homolog; acc. no. A7RK30 [Pyronema omphalodes CBS 100304]|uniref:Similar to Quinone oxidoreductase-like protein 2 homolog acc. no. A7RK30 n=1 Tax=Pyronema omphalodes (strain CBS 100304) TaxID=1076935 RepID=U4LJF3_PYROM|nr:Similar to Quinone oxidoreductase-like protein 2 homolog; acc. no. A7RK30 [Pyronema omphalodes CBS 100304]
MRALHLTTLLPGPSALQVTTQPDPIPSKNEYLISIRASAANFFDLLQIRGKYQHQPKLPWIAGSEFSGVVISAPSGGKYPVGTKVFGAAQGAFATKVCAREETLLPVPEGWGFKEAAGLFVTAPTSYAALVTRAQLKKGETVLVHAGAGGVGLAAIQIAKAYGARVIASAGSEEKRGICKEFGADEVVDYREKEWVKVVMKLTGGKGVDVVYDPVGMVNQSLSCTAWNGRILVVGFAGGKIEEVKANRVLLKNVSVVGIHWGMYAKNEPEMVPITWKGIFDLIKQGKFRGTVFSGQYTGLKEMARALEDLETRKTWGKVVVDVPEEEEKARL